MMPILAVLAIHSAFLVADSDLDSIARSAVKDALAKFGGLKEEQIGVSIGRIDRSTGTIHFGNFRGEEKFYPASTVKLFYLAYGATLLDSGKLKMTPELERGFTDMIVDSTNDATALILDSITGTTGGPELNERDLKKWMDKRDQVNRWLKKQGFEGINANQKTWNEGPYGRERQGYGPNFENRNSLTPNSGVRMMGMIALDKVTSGERAEWMKKLLHRLIPADSKEADFQSSGFTGSILPSGAQLWSKAGYTDTARLDIAWTKLPNGHEYIFSIFTRGQSKEPQMIPFVARQILTSLGEPSRPPAADIPETP